MLININQIGRCTTQLYFFYYNHYYMLCFCVIFQELFSACNPIATKPKPKVELPKEETPAEQNGPVNGQEKPQEETGDKGTTENTGNPTSETTENKPDMDLD